MAFLKQVYKLEQIKAEKNEKFILFWNFGWNWKYVRSLKTTEKISKRIYEN